MAEGKHAEITLADHTPIGGLTWPPKFDVKMKPGTRCFISFPCPNCEKIGEIECEAIGESQLRPLGTRFVCGSCDCRIDIIAEGAAR